MKLASAFAFSFLTARIATPQTVCHITRTTPETHAIIREIERCGGGDGLGARRGPQAGFEPDRGVVPVRGGRWLLGCGHDNS